MGLLKKERFIDFVKAYKKLIDNKLFDFKLVLAGAKNLNGYSRLYFDVKNYIDQYNLNDYIDM